jgi:polyhydroxyalkanoate synthase
MNQGTPISRPTPGRRLGPRPLPVHLAVAAATWGSSLAVLPALKSGSLPWKAALRSRAEALRSALEGVPPEAFAAAVEAEARRRFQHFLEGVEAYRHHTQRRAGEEPPAIWRAGTTRLLDYGGEGPAVLAVPSLINRAYVLDLAAERSLLRSLARQGFRVFLLDWDAPGATERGFTLDDYVAGRLVDAIDVAARHAGGPIRLLGYCMGGTLALAAALLARERVAALALLAAPWDFHAERPEQARALAASLAPFWPAFEALGEVPLDVLQTLFAALDPQLALRKFLAFAAQAPDSAEARAFVALEDWANDGVPLAVKVARQCLEGWYGANDTAEGRWRVAGRMIDPGALDVPTLVVVPERDRIVPPASAAALGTAIPGARTLRTGLGHVGMVVGGRAEAEVWRPLGGWLKAPSRP